MNWGLLLLGMGSGKVEWGHMCDTFIPFLLFICVSCETWLHCGIIPQYDKTCYIYFYTGMWYCVLIIVFNLASMNKVVFFDSAPEMLLWYGDSIVNAVEENANMFSLIWVCLVLWRFWDFRERLIFDSMVKDDVDWFRYQFLEYVHKPTSETDTNRKTAPSLAYRQRRFARLRHSRRARRWEERWTETRLCHMLSARVRVGVPPATHAAGEWVHLWRNSYSVSSGQMPCSQRSFNSLTICRWPRTWIWTNSNWCQ